MLPPVLTGTALSGSTPNALRILPMTYACLAGMWTGWNTPHFNVLDGQRRGVLW